MNEPGRGTGQGRNTVRSIREALLVPLPRWLLPLLLHLPLPFFPFLYPSSLFLSSVAAPDDRRGAYYTARSADTSCARKINTRASIRLDLDEQSANDVKVEKSLR